MIDQNQGVLIASPKPTDYILGSNSPLNADRNVKDWSPYLPANESQRNNFADFLTCVTMSGADHSIVTQLNYLISSGKFSDEAMNFFHNENYLVDGKFSLSTRFNAKLNNTEGLKGNYLNTVAECARRDGLLPEMDWPTTRDMSFTEFYQQIPIGLFAKAKKALWFINIQYHWVYKEDLKNILPNAPVQIATKTCPGWDSGQVVQKCSSDVLNHATMLYGQDDYLNWLDFDQYSPFKQPLAENYELPLCLQYLITTKPLMLRNGMKGSNVLELQKDLNRHGFLVVADSQFGPKTESKLKTFQVTHGLSADGIAGPMTLSKLNESSSMNTIEEIIRETAVQEGVEPELAIAVAKCEGGINTATAVRHNPGSIDRGIFQWNDKYHPEITDAMAFDPKTATQLFCKAVKAGHLHAYWSASEPNWKKLVSPAILAKYGIR